MIRENDNATFVVCESYGTIADPVPAKTDTAYLSVMLFGKVGIVEDLTEATAAMQELLNKYVPGYYDTPLASSHVEKYRSSMGSKTAVFKLVPAQISAKESPLVEEMAFYPGRKASMDVKE
jgi:nitroimidazol reductase NimA-like FMN-containing flavoprotein (pyridoxamine 5'-phosphate oxidase superfamily)